MQYKLVPMARIQSSPRRALLNESWKSAFFLLKNLHLFCAELLLLFPACGAIERMIYCCFVGERKRLLCVCVAFGLRCMGAWIGNWLVSPVTLPFCLAVVGGWRMALICSQTAKCTISSLGFIRLYLCKSVVRRRHLRAQFSSSRRVTKTEEKKMHTQSLHSHSLAITSRCRRLRRHGCTMELKG